MKSSTAMSEWMFTRALPQVVHVMIASDEINAGKSNAPMSVMS